MSPRKIHATDISLLSRLASQEPRLRKHLNLHTSHTENCQKLFNAISQDSYIHPHQHTTQGPELLLSIHGKFALIIFDNNGHPLTIDKFAHFSPKNPSIPIGVEIPTHVWHTVIATESNSVLFEVKPGPFNPLTPKELANWAPPETSFAAKNYLKYLQELVDQYPD